jgi:NAD(P)-dependent dehydrogenase (short-subunit alcohol dehydrogenase family)
LDIEDDKWVQGNDMMVMSVVRMSRLVTPVMERQGKGAILNITTFAAFEPSLIFPVSCVYRAGVGAFTKLYSDRYAEAGIRMNALLPGFVDSLDHSEETAQKVPMKRVGSVEEVAKTAAFLLSDDAGYITGQNIRVDGGITRHV